MSEEVVELPIDVSALVENIVTEDDEPLDNLFSEKQQRLLTESLYSSWTPPVPQNSPTTSRHAPFLRQRMSACLQPSRNRLWYRICF
jgi:hypothetical protein